MSREQRRQQSRGKGGGTNRRTPVQAPGGNGVPWLPIAIVGGAVAIVALIVYLVIQSTGSEDELSAADKAEQDSSPELAGTFVNGSIVTMLVPPATVIESQITGPCADEPPSSV